MNIGMAIADLLFPELARMREETNARIAAHRAEMEEKDRRTKRLRSIAHDAAPLIEALTMDGKRATKIVVPVDDYMACIDGMKATFGEGVDPEPFTLFGVPVECGSNFEVVA